MVDDQLNLEAKITFEGLGSVDGDKRTLSDEACNEIADIARADLRERYTDISDDDWIYVLAINAPNVAIVTESAPEGE